MLEVSLHPVCVTEKQMYGRKANVFLIALLLGMYEKHSDLGYSLFLWLHGF